MTLRRRCNKREFLRLFGGVGLLSAAGCAADADASIAAPRTALTDEPIRIGIEGIEPQSALTVRATARSRNGTDWEARARYDVSDDGTVSVPGQAPVDGTYEGVDPMGLFWSMRPADADPDRPLPPEVRFVPDEAGYDVDLTAEVDGETVAESTTTRRLYDPAIERRTVDHDGIVGEFFAPPGDEPAPAVVHLHGAGGRPHVATGKLLASRGIATLTLQYFGDPEPIPDALVEVPVEYVETAMTWLRERSRVAGPDVGLFGFSRGGELALLLGSRSGDVGAIVGWVPSGIVWEGLGPGRTPAGTSAWSIDGNPVPFLELADADPGTPPTPGLPYFEPALSAAGDDELAAATIPVEEAEAPILLVSATDDRRWPSTALSDRVVDRLDARGYPHGYRHDSHDGAGHYVRFPYLPTAGTAKDAYNVYGGSREANARANADAWFETLSFLEGALGG
ncbi:acyl-CoA thioesterase/bile acid-CoA:amino acid N-acyltransferase family protein [Halegenticoccus soli]|uniref:acyl-CoA thioesterase/bile acid-CoA:amino acid N-acyltransferase family protein n=1 Tax=Halegenticoccus soli TaxID=1985678 RepID=UPI000C6E197F|nr:acyl-CoA thioesterase/bile acid-CoA:amino acid N-acyltransferase family protein [Halegenticoccus soli]